MKLIGSTLAQIPVSGTGIHFIRGFGTGDYVASGAGLAKNGSEIIPDNIGDPGYRPVKDSDLIIDYLDSKYSYPPGEEGTNQKLPQDLKTNSEQVKAGQSIISENEGQDGYSPYRDSELENRVQDSGQASKYQSTLELLNSEAFEKLSNTSKS